MKTLTAILGIVLAALVGAFGYWTISPYFINVDVQDSVSEGAIASEPVPIVETAAHPASGFVRLLTESDGSRLIHYENFKTLNGPDLYVYLASDTNATTFVNLGRIKGTEGNISYTIPDGVNIEEYPYVLTWCKAFGVLFNYADMRTLFDQPASVCIQVITPARYPDTGEIREFPTPCDVPDGWETIENDIPGLELEVQ